jgi:hypothetical protein
MTSHVSYNPKAFGPKTPFTPEQEERGRTVPPLNSAFQNADYPNGRPIHIIAREIERAWGTSAVNYAARSYLDAMKSLDNITASTTKIVPIWLWRIFCQMR